SRISILDADGKALTKEVSDPKYMIDNLVYCPVNDCLAVGESIMTRSSRLTLYDGRDLSVKRVIPLKNRAHSIAFSRDGKTLALGGADRQVQRIDVETGNPIGAPLLQEQIVAWIAFLNNDRYLVTSSEKGQILLWDIQTSKRIGPAFEHKAALISTAIDPAGK